MEGGTSTVYTVGRNAFDGGSLDGGGARLNMERTAVATLPAGTYSVDEFVFNATQDGGGYLVPCLAVTNGAESFETVWVGAQVTPAGAGIGTNTYSGEGFTLSSEQTVYGGVYHDGNSKLYFTGGGVTAHDNGADGSAPILPSSVGQTLTNFSHFSLARQHDFSIDVSSTGGHVNVGQTLYVGYTNTTGNTFTHSAGLVSATDVTIGDQQDSSGAYTMDGADADLQVSAALRVGRYSGASGTFTQHTGVVAANEVYLAPSGGATGTYVMAGGELSSIGATYVGTAGTGSFTMDDAGANLAVGGDLWVGTAGGVGTITHNAGTANVSGQLKLGHSSNGSASYTMTGGVATLGSLIFPWFSGTGTLDIGGSGVMTNNGATTYVGNRYGVGTISLSDNATLDHSGSMVIGRQAGSESSVGNAVSVYDNASLQVGVEIQLGQNATSDGTLNLHGGSVVVADDLWVSYGGTGTVVQSGGAVSISNRLGIGSSSGRYGYYTITNGTLDTAGSLLLGSSTGSGLFHVVGTNASITIGDTGDEDFTVQGNSGEVKFTFNTNDISVITVQDDINLNGNGTITVTNASGSALSEGIYTLMSSSNGTVVGEFGTETLQNIGTDARVEYIDNPGLDDYRVILIVGGNATNITYEWDAGGGTDSDAARDWSYDFNWTGDSEPGIANNAYVNSNYTGVVAYAGERVANLFVGSSDAGAVLTGSAPTGNVLQTAGELTIATNLYLGDNAGDKGTYVIEDGVVAASNHIYVGESGEGTLTIQAGNYRAKVEALNPIAYYTMDADDITGSTVANRGSLPNTASLASGATFVSGGFSGGGLNVDDNSSQSLLVDDGVIDLVTAWTVSAWFKDLHPADTWRTMSRGSNAGGHDHQVIVFNSNNDLGTYDNAGGGFRDSGHDLSPGDNRWHHIAAVNTGGEGSGGQIDFYIDGVWVGQSDYGSGTDIDWIGGYPNQPFAQTLDEFAVFDSALTAVQVASLAGANVSAGGNLYIANGANSSGSVTQHAGVVNATQVRMGDGAASSSGYTMTNGILGASGQIYVGINATSTGTVSVAGSGRMVSDLNLVIGSSGEGNLTISGAATVRTEYVENGALNIGNAGSANGTVTVNGGALESASEIRIGDWGEGTLNVNGGTVHSESYRLSLGTFNGSKGTMNITGGKVISESNLEVGWFQTGCEGVLTMGGGTLSVSNTINVGVNGDGTMTVTGGTVTSTGSLVIDSGTGSGLLNVVGTNSTITVGDGSDEDLTVNANGTLKFTFMDTDDITAITVQDDIDLNSGSTITVTNASGSALADGIYTLVTSVNDRVVGTFSTTNLQTIGTDARVDYFHNALHSDYRVVLIVGAAATNITYEWDAGGGTGDNDARDWSYVLNWTGDTEPGSGNNAYVNSNYTAVVANGGEAAATLYVGSSNAPTAAMAAVPTGTVEQIGGDLALSADLVLGDTADARGTYNLQTGVVTIANDAYVGNYGEGVLTIDGGLSNFDHALLAPATITTNVPEAAGYALVYDLTIPDNQADESAIPYSTDNAALLTNGFRRIAYFLELDGEWVWVSMDAFTTNIAEVGIPHPSGNPVDFEQLVANMNVAAGGGAEAKVTTGKGIATGNIEIWPSNYGNTADDGIGGANSYDFDDSGGSTSAGYGSFQVHNYGEAETIFAYNRFGNASGNDDLGIGNRPATSDTDWTFADNADTYTSKRLRILVQSGASMAVGDYQGGNDDLLIGNQAGSTGTVTVSDCAVLQATDKIRVGVNGNGSLVLSNALKVATIDDSVDIGAAAGSTGTVTMTGGYLEVGNALDIGYSGAGYFTLNGADAEVVVNGALRAGRLDGSVGTFTHNTGTVTVSNNAVIADVAGSTGTYALGGGLLDVGNSLYVGNNGDGALTVTGGALTTAGSLLLPSTGSGLLHVAGSSQTITVGDSNDEDFTVNDSGELRIDFTNGTDQTAFNPIVVKDDIILNTGSIITITNASSLADGTYTLVTSEVGSVVGTFSTTNLTDTGGTGTRIEYIDDAANNDYRVVLVMNPGNATYVWDAEGGTASDLERDWSRLSPAAINWTGDTEPHCGVTATIGNGYTAVVSEAGEEVNYLYVADDALVRQISGGVKVCTDIRLGNQSDDIGTYTITNGQLYVSDRLHVGEYGHGILNISGGSANDGIMNSQGSANGGTTALRGGLYESEIDEDRWDFHWRAYWLKSGSALYYTSTNNTLTQDEGAVAKMVSNYASGPTLHLSFDYDVSDGDTLFAHLWGYTGTSDLDGQGVVGLNTYWNGAIGNLEAGSDELDAFNLKDGATTGFGGTNSAISGPLTGSGVYQLSIDIATLGGDLPAAGISDIGDFTYFMLAFGKNEDGQAGVNTIDDVLLSAGTAVHADSLLIPHQGGATGTVSVAGGYLDVTADGNGQKFRIGGHSSAGTRGPASVFVSGDSKVVADNIYIWNHASTNLLRITGGVVDVVDRDRSGGSVGGMELSAPGRLEIEGGELHTDGSIANGGTIDVVGTNASITIGDGSDEDLTISSGGTVEYTFLTNAITPIVVQDDINLNGNGTLTITNPASLAAGVYTLIQSSNGVVNGAFGATNFLESTLSNKVAAGTARIVYINHASASDYRVVLSVDEVEAEGITYEWDAGEGTATDAERDWGNVLNWTGDTEPHDAANAWVNGGYTGVVLYADGVAGTLYVGSSNAPTAALAATPTGTVVQTGGMLTLSNGLVLGETADGQGSYTLSGGTLVVPVVSNGVSGSGTFNFNGGTLKASQDTTDFIAGLTAPIVLAGGAVIDGGGYRVTIAEDLTGSGGLTNVGTGWVSLPGDNIYTGQTAVVGGTLLIDGSLSSDGDTVTAHTAGTLAGTGTVSRVVQIGDGGTLAPGATNGLGVLTVATNVTMQTNGTLSITIAATSPGQYGRLEVTAGDVALGTGVANLSLDVDSYTAASGDMLWIINNTGTGTTTGYFSGYPAGSQVTAGGKTFFIQYDGDFDTKTHSGGNDVVLLGTISGDGVLFEIESGGAAGGALPFVETFDSRSTAPLNGQNSWRAVATGNATVQENTVFGGNKAAWVNNAVAWRDVGPGSDDVWMDCYVRPTRRTAGGDPEPGTNTVAAFYINSSGNLRVSSNATWVTLASYTVPSNDWTRVTTRLDCGADTWSIYACNSVSNNLENPLASNLAFRVSGGSSISGVRVTVMGGSAYSYVDSLTVADHDSSSLPLSVDHGGDGISDLWALHFFNSATNRPGDSDSDNDGWTDLQEYLAGTDPTNATSYMRIVNCDLASKSSTNLVFTVESGGHTVTSIYAGDVISRQYQLRAVNESPGDGKSAVLSLTDDLSGTNFLTDSGATELYTNRFYDIGVSLGGSEYVNTQEWAMHVQPREQSKRYLVSVPVDYAVGSNALDSTLGLQIARGLTPGLSHAQHSDQIRFDDGLTFSTYSFVTNGSGGVEWHDGEGESSRVVAPGEGFWVFRTNSVAARTDMVFVGLTRTSNVPAITMSTNDMSQGWDAQIFGWPYNKATSTAGPTKNPFGFAGETGSYGSRHGGTTTDHDKHGDQIWYWEDGWRYVWLVDTGGARSDLDDTWWNSVTRTNAVLSLEPGKAYYYRHHVELTNGTPTGGQFNWQPELP